MGDNTSPSFPSSLSLPSSTLHLLPAPTRLMSDTAPPEGTALPTLSALDPDAPPSSAGRSSVGASGPDPPPQETTAIPEEIRARLDKVIYSELLTERVSTQIGVFTLLTRLKQSVASARDFSTFLKKRGALEDEHAQGLRKLSRAIGDAASRSENRQGTYSSSYKDIHRLNDRMADHGQQFAVSLAKMADDMAELATNVERVVDAEAHAEKAKAKYDSFAEQYDRVRTGDRQGGKFGLKGHKSAAQHEEDLLRKVQNADSDYSSKVQAAQEARRELVATGRPQAARAILQLIEECDSGLTLQQQKFAVFSEKLLLGQGLCVSPLRTSETNGALAPKSLSEVVRQVDNEKDLHEYILSHEGNAGAVASDEIKYVRHPTLGGSTSTAAPSQPSTQPKPQSTLPQSTLPQSTLPQSTLPQSFSQQNIASPVAQPSPSAGAKQAPYPTEAAPPSGPPPGQPPYPVSGPPPSDGPPPLGQMPGHVPMMMPPPKSNLPPLKPVFGVSLYDLYTRDGTAVPMIVYQCFQAIELFGLDVEGIYRLSGSANHISHMKAVFDNDSSQVDFTNPENFYHDVNSVAGLLKQFFRELPDPLFTSQYYADFVNAARIDDDIQRRDSLHALINSLPDAHYATLRAIILHLNKVQEHSSQNRMNAGNIAICFGPTLMGANSGGNIADAGWQVRVIETILVNTFQIFDDD
ncbi:hypothetical protein N7510_000911 [Penicillium lagena]|uniref:uncharacterized protein n=1 Tax=Penicillium lagena TaxID=94218 RepID=UPI002541721A|nr:uncharacterized protein N7510_000911 [Penicillium lagena]KAJ5624602.1 hypothetical protein N7510_000911 [Penicillium lagena]